MKIEDTKSCWANRNNGVTRCLVQFLVLQVNNFKNKHEKIIKRCNFQIFRGKTYPYEKVNLQNNLKLTSLLYFARKKLSQH